MINICFISQCTLPIPTCKGGAVETLVEYLLDENEKEGKFHFTVISIDDEEIREKAKQYEYTDFIYVRSAASKFNSMLYQLHRVLKHIGVFIPFSFEFAQALKVLRKIKNHDYYIYEAGPTAHLPILNRIIPKEKLLVHLHWEGMGNKSLDKCFEYLIPVSNYIGECWKKATGCTSAKICPLYNCAKIKQFMHECSDIEKSALKKKLEISDTNKIILFVGRIVAEKGIKELLLAFERVQRDDVTLLVIGSANFGKETRTLYEQEISELIATSKKNIVFTGFVHQTELYKYYSIADIAVMPSLFQDPAPLVAIETQATGTPLIVTCVGGIPEYVGKDCAILIENKDDIVQELAIAIEKLLNNPELCIAMSTRAQNQAQNFSTEKYYRDFEKLMLNVKGGCEDER